MRFKAIFRRFKRLWVLSGVTILKYKDNKKSLFYKGCRREKCKFNTN